MRKQLLAICLVSASESTFPNSIYLPAEGISAWLKTRRSWIEVPTQVDERDRNGDYVLENGQPFTANGGDGVFNGQDELVLEFPVAASESVEITDATAARWLRDHGLGPGDAIRSRVTAAGRDYELMFVRGGKFPALPTAARFENGSGMIHAGGYRYRFNRDNPAAIGSLEIPGGTRGEFATINEDGGFALWLSPPWGFPVVSRSNEDLDGAVESWRAGPVRSIVAVGSKYTAFWSLMKAHLFSELVFYRDRFQIPSVVDIPFSPGKLLGLGSGFAYAMRLEGTIAPEVEQNAEGRARVSVVHSSGLVLSASVDPALARAGVLPHVWQRGRTGATATVPDHVARWFKDTGATTGFFVDISRMERGRYDFALDLESPGKANQSHTDFLTCKSVWTPMVPTQTSRPVTKQE